MRPVQVYLAMCKRSVNLNSREAAMAFGYPCDVRNSEAAIQFRQNRIHIVFAEKSENSAAGRGTALSLRSLMADHTLTVWSHEYREQKWQLCSCSAYLPIVEPVSMAPTVALEIHRRCRRTGGKPG